MARETGVQSQVESYQRLKKWYLMPPCLTLSIIRYGSRVKRSNLGKGVAPSPTPRCSSYRKGSLRGHPQLWSPTLLTYIGYSGRPGFNPKSSYIKDSKMVLDAALLCRSIIRYVSIVKGGGNPGKGVAPSPTPQCSSNWSKVADCTYL